VLRIGGTTTAKKEHPLTLVRIAYGLDRALGCRTITRESLLTLEGLCEDAQGVSARR
jgi:hypothetical protein